MRMIEVEPCVSDVELVSQPHCKLGIVILERGKFDLIMVWLTWL